MKMFSNNNQRGFTLVEMIIALAIFSIVAIVAVGALLRITDANKKSQSLKTAINNLNFALESMSREMRVGGNYACQYSAMDVSVVNDAVVPATCSIDSGPWVVAFNSSKTAPDGAGGRCNLVHAYMYDGNTIRKHERASCDGSFSLDNSEFFELVSPDVVITDAIIRVGLTQQPLAFFWLKGYTGQGARQKTEFEIQTSVSQRIGD